MNPLLAVAAAAAGYLCGSVSFPRILARRFAPGKSIAQAEIQAPGTEAGAKPTVYGAYNASLVLGARMGIVISLLDMVKVALPTLAFRLYAPGEPYYLFASLLGLVGHIWPLWHRFRGGRGFTAILGGFLAVDPLGVPVTLGAGMLFGMAVLGNKYAAYSLWLPLMIPWMWLRTHSLWHVLWAVVLNVVFFVATIPEIRAFARMRREGTQQAYDQSQESAHPMWRTMARWTEALRIGKKS